MWEATSTVVYSISIKKTEPYQPPHNLLLLPPFFLLQISILFLQTQLGSMWWRSISLLQLRSSPFFSLIPSSLIVSQQNSQVLLLFLSSFKLCFFPTLFWEMSKLSTLCRNSLSIQYCFLFFREIMLLSDPILYC